MPGLTIENEYRPAREVGGDFNQIIPYPADGSLLIVAGDVAGKGLQAGMLVALLVGAIRMAAEVSSDPLFILQALNRRLLGRGEAHATCLAMRIAADGAVTLANAGHLPPYLNGKPVEMEGALPLGVIDDAEFTVTHFQLQENDRLVLASDGIVEAMDEQHRLFGFERLQELLQTQADRSGGGRRRAKLRPAGRHQRDRRDPHRGAGSGLIHQELHLQSPLSSRTMNPVAERGPRRVESRQNSRIKELRAALARGAKTPHIAVEGLHLIEEAVKSGLKLHTVFVRSGNEGLLEHLAVGDAEVLIVTEDVFLSATITEHPQGIAALVEAPEFTLQAMLRGTPLVVIAAGLQDPGNLGTLVRSAEAFGATGMILLPGTVSLWNAKTLRASSGSAFRLPVIAMPADDAFAALREAGVQIFAAVARDGEANPICAAPAPCCWAMRALDCPMHGSPQADARVTIPCPGAVESLNAAVAGSILLYEAMRQRRIA